MGIGLTFAEFVVLRLRALAGADSVFNDAAERERKVEIQAAGKTPAVSIVAYTGGVMAVPGWGPVAIELAGGERGRDVCHPCVASLRPLGPDDGPYSANDGP